MKVVKFGGSSLATGAQMAKVLNIIVADPQRRIIVTSALGKRFASDIKVTDLLIKYAQQVLQHQDYSSTQQQIWARYQEIADYFHLNATQLRPLKTCLWDLPQQNYPNDDYLMAAFKAHGECLNAQLLAIILQKKVPTRYVDPKTAGIQVSNDPQDAHILQSSYQQIAKINIGHDRIVVPGFYGITSDQQIATFSRGGSDITGAILAYGLQADLYENFTDVNAVYAADPRLVDHPQAIQTMTYRELRELSYAGFSVFHDEALLPAIEGQVPIKIKNTNHPDLPGTLIVPQKYFQPQKPITGVASSSHFAALYLHRYLLNKEVGFTLKLLKIFYEFNISYEHMPSGIDDLTVIFDKRQFIPTKQQQLLERVKMVIQPDELEWIDDYSIIMVVGEGIRLFPDFLQKIFDPLARQGIRVHMINQGASQISIMLGTKQSDAALAVQQIYQSFFPNQNGDA